MIVKIADNIISPLGFTSEANYQAVRQGLSRLMRYEGKWGIPEPFVASLFDEESVEQAWLRIKNKAIDSCEDYTFFEKMVILSAHAALQEAQIDTTSDRVLFILSTTKGNVSLLSQPDGERDSRVLLGVTASRIARFFGNCNTPIAVSNACISGLCAQIEALRAIESGRYDYVVTMGADQQSPFIISGFQSFKALSPEPCKPFDAARQGLNLGEAAATIIYAKADKVATGKSHWVAHSGAIRNDANHISGPSRTGEGSYRALMAVLQDDTHNVTADKLACINVHGTATAYNDEMESFAIERAGLSHVPVNALKGYYGHTMGAAGVLESILTMHALDDHTILPTRGFDTLGVSHPVSVTQEITSTEKHAFVKLLSGFGGCNAAMLFERCELNATQNYSHPQVTGTGRCDTKVPTVTLTPEYARVNGCPLDTQAKGGAMLTELYRTHIGDYPKYFKMDGLCRLGFVATELLLKTLERPITTENGDEVAIVFFNQCGSLCDDVEYQRTIQDPENYFPSPSVFVYTLPNIVTGEVAIRNHYYGETSFIVIDKANTKVMAEQLLNVFLDNATQVVVGGWMDCRDSNTFCAQLFMIRREQLMSQSNPLNYLKLIIDNNIDNK